MKKAKNRIDFIDFSSLVSHFRLLANSTSVAFTFGGCCNEASSIWSFESGWSTESRGGSSTASRIFVAISWGSSAFLVQSFELTVGVAA